MSSIIQANYSQADFNTHKHLSLPDTLIVWGNFY